MKKIKELIAQDKLNDAIIIMLEYCNDTDLKNSLISLSGRYKNLENTKTKGIIRLDEYFVEVNKIRYSLLEIFDDVYSEKNKHIVKIWSNKIWYLINRNIGAKNVKIDSIQINSLAEREELILLLQYRAEQIMRIFDSLELELRKERIGKIKDHEEAILKSKELFQTLHIKHIDALKNNKLILANDIANDIHQLLHELLRFDLTSPGIIYSQNSYPSIDKELGWIFCKLNHLEIPFFGAYYENGGELSLHPNEIKFKTVWSYIDDVSEGYNESRRRRIQFLINAKDKR